ncbi:Lrp/AsnC family transcriptional regulator [Glutamicibacter sp. NPDC087344]|uniref:Lrp/AsnC family transcriptional regulator n=1 Tax=Glutamicibacter sp. NPDC087344 TaxID=3363994 RepID=UPI0037FD4BE4
MVTAFVMIQTATDSIPECAQQISEIEGIREVYSVAGDWDLIAIAHVHKHEDLAEVIANKLSKIPGIRGTQTHIAFRAYSTHDLDAAFSLDLGE